MTRNIPYEIFGEGLAIAEAFFGQIDEAEKAQFAVARELGANGFRPSRNGTIKSLMFSTLPAGFRRIGSESGRVEAVPLMSTKIGKAAAAKLKEAPVAQSVEKLPELFGFNRGWIIEGDGRVYFATSGRVTLPQPRYFLLIPRKPDDKYVPPETLREMLYSDYEGAFHEHNMLAAKRRSELAAA